MADEQQTDPGSEEQPPEAADDTSSAVKSRARRKAPKSEQPAEGDTAGPSPEAGYGFPGGISSHSLGSPETLTGGAFGRANPGQYVMAQDDAWIAHIPRYAQRPTTTRLWSRGQLVRADHYERYKDTSSHDPRTAPVVADHNQPDGRPVES